MRRKGSEKGYRAGDGKGRREAGGAKEKKITWGKAEREKKWKEMRRRESEGRKKPGVK